MLTRDEKQQQIREAFMQDSRWLAGDGAPKPKPAKREREERSMNEPPPWLRERRSKP